ncbi:DNA replication and repair protein RecF domain protein [Streptococcus oralis SK313]|uniref:DNA replication and repair protein RecF domain protein n=1 Tax=Streptococcus oralis SK313 TaxID=1035190 RepID=F9Q0U7_STROR|nr:DNA replication and repair protein RecF domain protein [Streptococcus oralis SK313]
MWLQHLTIKTFRNYKEAKIDFNPKLNIFLGQNAQGKPIF